MAIFLTLDEMLAAARALDVPGSAAWQGDLEALGGKMAKSIAEHCGIKTTGAFCEHPTFGGTCGVFKADNTGQKCPPDILQFDPGGDWETLDGTPAGEVASDED